MKYRSSLSFVSAITLCLALPAFAGEKATAHATIDAWSVPSGHTNIVVHTPTITIIGDSMTGSIRSSGTTGGDAHAYAEADNVTGEFHGERTITAEWVVDNNDIEDDFVTLSSTNHASGDRQMYPNDSAFSFAQGGDDHPNWVSGQTSSTVQSYSPSHATTQFVIVPALGSDSFTDQLGTQADHS